jgi:hypothetical protein
MQKPRFKTSEKAAWVFIHTKLHPTSRPTIDRRTALRCGYLTTASRKLNVSEKDLPLPFEGESISKYLARAAKGQPVSQR